MQSGINTMKPLNVKVLEQKLASRYAQETGPRRQRKVSSAASTGANNAAWNKSYRELLEVSTVQKGLREHRDSLLFKKPGFLHRYCK